MATALNDELPLVVILGPTASGKTDVAIKLARELGGEVICADSRTVYRGLDIGTAKPTVAERAAVPHHLVDIVDPDEPYNAARFQQDASAAIAAIRARRHVPIMVGGSGLYIDSILFEYHFSSPSDPKQREKLSALSIDELFKYCIQNNVMLPDNYHNKRYLIRAIEQNGVNISRRSSPVVNTIIVGITTEDIILKERIRARASQMFQLDVAQEADRAAVRFGWGAAPLQAPVYQISHQLLDNRIGQEEAIEQLARSDWQLVRKQRTWFKRNAFITWLQQEDVAMYVRQRVAHVGRVLL